MPPKNKLTLVVRVQGKETENLKKGSHVSSMKSGENWEYEFWTKYISRYWFAVAAHWGALLKTGVNEGRNWRLGHKSKSMKDIRQCAMTLNYVCKWSELNPDDNQVEQVQLGKGVWQII